MNTPVSLNGSDRFVNRLGDAVRAQQDMLLFDPPALAVDGSCSSATNDADESNIPDEESHFTRVQISDSRVRVSESRSSLQVAEEPETGFYTSLTPESSCEADRELLLPGADSLSLARLVRVVSKHSKIRRLYTTVVRRAARATDDAKASLDALQPVFGDALLEQEVAIALSPFVPVCQIRSVIASYTHSHLQMIKLDLVDSIEREQLIDSLRADSRILVGSADDGISSTADIHEFFRDLGRTRGDRWESFIWEDSILIDNSCICLMQDISPDSSFVPEVIDAIRLLSSPQLERADICRRTDNALGMLQTLCPLN